MALRGGSGAGGAGLSRAVRGQDRYNVAIALHLGMAVLTVAVARAGQGDVHGDGNGQGWTLRRAAVCAGLGAVPAILPRRAVPILKLQVLDLFGDDVRGLIG